MAGVGPVNKNELTPGIEYTFIFNNEDRVYGMLETYLGNNRGNPRGAVRLYKNSRRNGVLQDGPQTFPLNLVNRVVQGYAIQWPPREGIPQPIIQPQPAYREGMRPSERFMKHGWKAQGERHIDAIHTRNPLNVNPDTYIDIRNVNRNTKPRSNYYSPEEIANMRATITIAECPICLLPIVEPSYNQIDQCRVCLNGHKFHLKHEGQTIPIVECPVCRVAPPFYSCNGNYNDIMSGGKKQKGKRKSQENPVENCPNVENRPDVGNLIKIELN
jgi:hypothetical protein